MKSKSEPTTSQKLYNRVLWKADLYVYQCSYCLACANDEDEMITHVLDHLPQEQRNAKLDQLVKEKYEK